MKEHIDKLVVIGAAYTLVANPLSLIMWSDGLKYLDMANGIGVVEPFSQRPLLPFVVGVLSDLLQADTARTFYHVNIVLFMLSALVLLREHGLTTALVTMICLSPAILFFGKVLLDSAIFFWVVVALHLRERPYHLTLWATLSAALHPMAFILCVMILLFSVRDRREAFLVVFPVLVFLVWFMPYGSYAVLMYPDLIDVIYTAKMMNALWLGVFFFRPNRQGILFLTMFVACTGFTFLVTMPVRAFPPLAALLGPQLIKEGLK